MDEIIPFRFSSIKFGQLFKARWMNPLSAHCKKIQFSARKWTSWYLLGINPIGVFCLHPQTKKCRIKWQFFTMCVVSHIASSRRSRTDSVNCNWNGLDNIRKEGGQCAIFCPKSELLVSKGTLLFSFWNFELMYYAWDC